MTQTTDRPVPDEVNEVDLAITGMTCAFCSARIEKKLGRLEGVDAVVNLATEKATVRYADPVTVEDLLSTVRSTGYGAEVAGPDLGHVGRRLALHDHQVSQPLLALPREVEHGRVGLQRAVHHAQQRDASRERIGDGLPHERRVRRRRRGLARDLLAVGRPESLERPLRR